MNRLRMIACAVAVFAVVGGAGGGRAQDDSDTLSVIAPPNVETWSKTVFRQFERKMRYPMPLAGAPMSEGIVAVRFGSDENGRPSAVRLHETSGHRDLDKATMRAVERIATLHPLPRGVSDDQQYVVRVLFASSENYARNKMKELRADAARQNAWVGRSGTTTAMVEILPVGG